MPTLSHRLLAALSLALVVLSAPAAEPATDLYGDPLPSGAVARLGSVRLRHQNAMSLAFAPDGKTFVTGGGDFMIRQWSVADGKEIRAFKGHASTINAIAFAADGKKLYSGSFDGTLREWDAAEGKELRSIHANPMQRFFFNSIVAHPTEALLLTADTNNANVREWDLKEGKETRSVAVAPGSGLTLCPDGKHFAVFKNDTVTLRDLTDKDVTSFKVGGVNRRVLRLTFSADGSTLAAGCSDLTVVIWDVKTGRELRTLPSTAIAASLALSSNGRYVVAKAAANSVRILGVASGQELRQFDVPNYYGGPLVFSPDNKRVAACQGNSIHLWDVETSRPLHDHVGHGSFVGGVRFSPDGKRLTSFGGDGTVIWWDMATARPLANWTGTGTSTFRLAPDGRSCYYSQFSALMRVELSDGKPGEHAVVRDQNAFLLSVAVSADNKLLAVRGRDQMIHFHSTADGKDLGKLPLAGSRYAYYAFAPDGKHLAGSDGRLVYFWDVPSGTATRQFDLTGKDPGRFVNLTGLQYSPDGHSLLTLTTQGVALWEASVGRERWRGPQTLTILSASAFSRDGRLAAVGNSTGVVYVLDTATGTQLVELPGHRGAVRSLDFAADGKRLASGSDDGTILVWDMIELSKKVQPEPVKLTDRQLADLWRDLGHVDSAKAYKAVRTLADSPQSAAYVQANIKGAAKFDEAHAKKLIVQLDDDDFDVREKAEKDLEGMGAAAVPLLREALKNQPSVEVRTRVERLLEPFKEQQVPTERLRGLRAVEVLELSGSEDAVKALKALAGGDAKEPLTQDAKAALERLQLRAGKP